ncbi:MAG TPA: matrixin family metalloprotease [Bryobacteraceae bacterium]|nr:matrixin family metalloprotease [Bryobacteraceae bacterium]
MGRRALVMMVALAALAPFSSAYYYYVLLSNAGGAWTAVPASFDLNPNDPYGLAGNTVTYLVSSQGPAAMMPGDTFPAVISQIRAAANVWNSVATSGIQVAFGGTSPMTQTDSVPEIDVVFSDDLPPGLIAQTVVTTASNAAALVSGGAASIPIVNSQIQLQSNLGPSGPFPQPSWSDEFFLAVAHEFGHALGLQHTTTSSLMTTNITRAATKAKPLAADDIAGISLLYPANGFAAATGSISGTVTLSGNGVNLATVVALSTNGTAVSALTNPDGSYRIGGVPPGQYYVYTQPLPPALEGEAYPDNVEPPVDSSGNVYNANNGFMGQFYGGGNDWTQAPQVNVTAGNVASGVNFNVAGSVGPSVYDLVLYSYIGNPAVPVQAPPLQQGSSESLEFYAWSTTTASGYMQLTPGLNVSVIGGAAQIVPDSLAALPNGYPYLYNYVWPGQVTAPTPVALAVTINGDLYVLPAAFTVVESGPVTVASATGSTDNNGNSTVTVSGTNLSGSSQIFFDGAPASLISANGNGSLTVAAPPAAEGYTASVEALNPDGQTSNQTLGAANPAQFTYGGPGFQAISLSPASVTAGTDAMVRVTGYNTDFLSGEVTAGFGSSNVAVKQVWVVSPTQLMLNISANGSAQTESSNVTLASGLQLETQAAAFQIAAAGGTQMTLRTPIVNQATQLAGVPSGGVAAINTAGMPASLSGWTLTIGGETAQFTFNGSQILAVVPSGLLVGPQIVQLTSSNGASIPPVAMQVDEAPPLITAVASASGAMLSASLAAEPGQMMLLTVEGLADAYGNLPAASAIVVNIGGVAETPASVNPVSAIAAQLLLTVPSTLAAGNAQITVQVGTRLSAPYTIPVE